MTRSHFIESLTILTKYVFDLGVRLTEFSVTVESVTLRFYCTPTIPLPLAIKKCTVQTGCTVYELF